jgi:hypothetical protein
MTPVESSHIAAVGLIEPDGVLLVRYRDGTLYARAGWTAAHYAALLAAPCKGSFLRNTSGASVLIYGKEGAQSTARAEWPATDNGPLNVIDEDADKCCRAGLAPFLFQNTPTTSWTCGTCGTEFVREVFPDLTRYWRIHPSWASAHFANFLTAPAADLEKWREWRMARGSSGGDR